MDAKLSKMLIFQRIWEFWPVSKSLINRSPFISTCRGKKCSPPFSCMGSCLKFYIKSGHGFQKPHITNKFPAKMPFLGKVVLTARQMLIRFRLMQIILNNRLIAEKIYLHLKIYILWAFESPSYELPQIQFITLGIISNQSWSNVQAFGSDSFHSKSGVLFE